MTMGIAPSEFWALSVAEWGALARAQINAAGPAAGTPRLTRAEALNLAALYPDDPK